MSLLQDRPDRLAAIVDSSFDAIIGVDVSGKITDWNQGATKLYGYAANEALGKQIDLITAPDRLDELLVVLQKLSLGEHVAYETVRRRRDGTLLDVSVTAFSVRDKEGNVIGAASIARDITERKHAAEALRRTDERFRLAAQAGKMFAYEWDAATDQLVRSGQCEHILGINEGVPFTGQQALAKVHPDDVERLKATLADLSVENPDLKVSYRMMRADGSLLWVERTSRAHFDGQGRLLRVVGMVMDITERKNAEEALANANRRLIEAQEQERTRIGRELHDDINQRLALLAIDILQLKNELPNPTNEVTDRITGLVKQTSDISADVQALSHELHSSRLEHLGVVAAIRGFCRDFSDHLQLEVTFTSHDVPDLPDDVSLCLFRVVQEALHNSSKYSRSPRYEVLLVGGPGEVQLKISDFGLGFDTEAVRAGRGLGLTSMAERVKLVSGDILINSQPSRGTTVSVRIPLRTESRSAQAAV